MRLIRREPNTAITTSLTPSKYTSGQSNQGLFEGLERKSFFFSLFLRNNNAIKCLKHCVRFELTTKDTSDKDFPDRGTNTYERDEKKKEKKKF
jgi:hypothetical protein